MRVIFPFASVELMTLPSIRRLSAFNWPVTVCVPVVLIAAVVNVPEKLPVPDTINPSLILIIVESSDERLVPLILIEPAITEPVPFPERVRLPFVVIGVIELF